MSASLIGRFGSSTFRPSTTGVLMSLAGSRFSSETASASVAVTGLGWHVFVELPVAEADTAVP